MQSARARLTGEDIVGYDPSTLAPIPVFDYRQFLDPANVAASEIDLLSAALNAAADDGGAPLVNQITVGIVQENPRTPQMDPRTNDSVLLQTDAGNKLLVDPSSTYGKQALEEWVAWQKHNTLLQDVAQDHSGEQVVETPAGQRNVDQIRKELRSAGYGGPWDATAVVAAYGRTVQGPQCEALSREYTQVKQAGDAASKAAWKKVDDTWGKVSIGTTLAYEGEALEIDRAADRASNAAFKELEAAKCKPPR